MIRLAGHEHHGFQHIWYQWKGIGSVITKSQTFESKILIMAQISQKVRPKFEKITVLKTGSLD